MIRSLLDFFFPRRSLTGIAGTWITDDELRRMRTPGIVLGAAALRPRGIRNLDSLVATCAYDDSMLVKTALRRLKYGGVHELADGLSVLLAGAVPLLPPGEWVIVPVPLHWRRRFVRGFNQSELLARGVAARTGCELRFPLRRVRSTGQQAKRTRAGRMTAMHRAFAVTDEEAPPRHVVLIDDVATTCATLDACAQALKDAGVRTVDALVVALG